MTNSRSRDPLVSMIWASAHDDTLPSLAERYSRHFLIGAAVEPYVLREQADLVAHHFRRLTAENTMKFGRVRPTEHCFDFAEADEIATFARHHSMMMTGHTFVWHQMQPRWLFYGADKSTVL